MSINDRNPANAIRKNVFIEFVIVLLFVLGCVLWERVGVLCLDSRGVMIYNNKYIFFYLFFFWVLDLDDLVDLDLDDLVDFVDLDLDLDLVLKIVP